MNIVTGRRWSFMICSSSIQCVHSIQHAIWTQRNVGMMENWTNWLMFWMHAVKSYKQKTLKHNVSRFFHKQGMRESNSRQRFWRPLSYHLTNPLYLILRYVPSKPHTNYLLSISNRFLRSSSRPISDSQLHTSLCFHLCPIYLIVSKGSLTLSSMDISSWGGLHA